MQQSSAKRTKHYLRRTTISNKTCWRRVVSTISKSSNKCINSCAMTSITTMMRRVMTIQRVCSQVRSPSALSNKTEPEPTITPPLRRSTTRPTLTRCKCRRPNCRLAKWMKCRDWSMRATSSRCQTTPHSHLWTRPVPVLSTETTECLISRKGLSTAFSQS